MQQLEGGVRPDLVGERRRVGERRLDPGALGHGLVALAAFPEVVEMRSTTGEVDLLLKIVARDIADLHRISGELLAVPDVVRTSTVISLREELPPRTRALIERAADQWLREGGRPSQGPRVRVGSPLHE
ncbi:Lrp/AsnC ligand binding domain-containing protein [Streptomyces sp. KR55]|uniref:Lrp/AsnC ligand binding domain-containing protein n=1 Tax=Streptomyces sp. KR55 TaxID=3457425 RepID=UPI003FD41A9B